MSGTTSVLHVTNLTGLLWLRRECQGSPEQAARIFDADLRTARFYAELADAAIDELCHEMDLALLVPRFSSTTLPPALEESRHGGRRGHASELELHNLCCLNAVREACQRSAGDAVWAYRINQETADAYRALSHGDVVTLSKTLSVSAFLPRYDATEAARILDKPVGARAVFAAAYEADIAATSEAARRSIYLTH